jgi:hypothetical protein
VSELTGGYPRRLPRSAEDDPEGDFVGEVDFAGEHADVSHSRELRGGPEGVPDEDVPSGLAGQDPTEAQR